MREILVARERLTDLEGKALGVEYYVLVEEAMLGKTFCCENYGVRIADSAGGGEAVSNITVSTRRIDELMELLVRNRVTPAALRDVVEDWLAAG